MIEQHRPHRVADGTQERLPDFIYFTYVKELGTGSLGRVILASDDRLKSKLVAIKLIKRGALVSVM
jgi:hypothetical protein